MKKEFGGINLIMCIGIILILALILFSLIIFKTINGNNQNTVSNTTVNNTVVEPTQEENTITPEQIQIDQKNTNFEYSFLKIENNKKNMLYSPLSISYALKMLQEGASGNTYTQITSLIGNIELPIYKNVDKNLSLANGIFIRDSFFNGIKDEYKKTLTSKYNAEILKDAFNSAANINKWIENKTLGLIKKALDDSALDINTEAVLVNALAIDMEWKEKFDTNDTLGKIFYLADGREMKATTMKKETSSDNVSFFKGNDITVLSMDLKEYDGQQLEFMAIMPDGNLDEYIKDFNKEKINDIDNNLKKASSTENGVNITIPKFKFEYDLGLKNDLQSLGIKDAFVEGIADFSNMSNSELYVSDAIHKANIDFSEEGIKAAAVTIFTVETKGMFEKEERVEINIDKPFLFLIRDKKSKTNWFVGSLYEPNSWEKDQKEYRSR